MDQKILTRDFKIQNKLGLHLRPASLIVETVKQFKSETFLSKDGTKIPANSIISVITLVAGKGSVITAEAKGEDAEKVLDALEDLIENRKFDEE
ncbi:HPr family phosphocarrier protein [Candidatus Poribacteria bacterium]|nr:HPr family phosphocarrier protein [Candidatus Poribacteria bacterium]